MTRLFACWLASLYGGWLVAWLVFPGLQDPLAAAVWWTGAKLVVWLVPLFFFARAIPLSAGALRLNHARRLPLALGVGVAWIALNALGDSLLGRTPAPALTPGVLSACFVAPFAEELVFRGFAFAWLEKLGFGFWRVNVSCAVLFALLHLPGWAFTQGLGLGLLPQLGQAALLGFGFGLLRKGDASLWAPIAVHFANNAWSQGLILWLMGAAR